MPDLAIGAPVRRREWVVGPYIKVLNAALCESDLTAHLVFVLPAGDPSQDALEKALDEVRDQARFSSLDLIYTRERAVPLERHWSAERVAQMVDLRNVLLRRVREVHPAFFLSLDSDILVAPDALGVALRGLRAFHAVGMRTYMDPPGQGPRPTGERNASHGQIVNGRLVNRYDYLTGLHGTDVIMAAKLMSRKAYEVDYQFHPDGEDVGWSQACAEVGVTLGYAAEARAKHIMRPEDLERVDPRVGF